MVKDVVKTRASKMQMWPSKNRQNHQDGGSSRKEKINREETQCGQPESSRLKYVVRKNRNRGQAMRSQAFESREAYSHLKGFFFFRRCRIVT